VVARVPVRQIVLLNAMIPLQGESAGQWWGNTGHARLDPDEEMFETFFHDVPAHVRAEAIARGERPQSGTPFQRDLPMPAWPAVPTRVLLGRDDRFFPADFQRRLARERLGITPDEMDGGHLVALSRPKDLAERLDAYQR
jgi:pimeloyl-ACP methyl ester carboxylesterase